MAQWIEDSRPGFSGIPGITRTVEGFQAAVWAKDAKDVSLLLYKKGTGEILQKIPYPGRYIPCMISLMDRVIISKG